MTHISYDIDFDSFDLLPSWHERAIILLDLDAFFASVEQLDNPGWKGLPVIVGSKSHMRGVVATASYEARAFGVHSAMPAIQAERLCPDAIWTPGRMGRYKELSAQIMDILKSYTPWVEQVSIDEAFCDISPGKHGKHPVEVCQAIRQNITQLGLSASIGLGTTKSVAKIASNLHKPQGLSVVYPGLESAFLHPQDISALSGIGPVAQEELRKRGIQTLGDLVAQPYEELFAVFKNKTSTILKRASAKEDSPIETSKPIKSISHELSFAQDLSKQEEVETALKTCAYKVAQRLRSHKLHAKQISIKLRFANRSIKSAQISLVQSSNNSFTIYEAAKTLLYQIWQPGIDLRLLGLSCVKFHEDEKRGGSLFEDAELQAVLRQKDTKAIAKQERLLQATDEIAARFGDEALSFGHSVQTKKRAGKAASTRLDNDMRML